MTHKLFGVREMVLAIVGFSILAFMGASMAFAQTSSYTPPSGYQQYGYSGVLYNSSNGLYFNPMTGQYSTLAPLGAASRDSSGAYIIPSGYGAYGTTGSYFNSSTGYYYDPTTGFYSTAAPMSTGVTPSMVAGYYAGTGTFTPGVPNTGMGGDSARTVALMITAALIGISGAVLASRKIA